MSEIQEIDFGIFPPGVPVEIEGFDFIRAALTHRLGRVSVFDPDDAEKEPIGYLPAGFKTWEAAVAWLAGYREGHKAGEAQGRRDLQRSLRALLDVQ